ncbi:hypothetical protein BDB01DRAFT_796596 [Pilobolus umbonatus]|nr:hypothetical protein BDB01DRAFT_796596 [Pilobolus umbonatus]
MDLISLPDSILIPLLYYVDLKDILELGATHTRLRLLIYENPKIWTSEFLFPAGDASITDNFIHSLVPRITRRYGILELKMICLPLSWAGYLRIFHQFAHSVKRIDIKTNESELKRLVHHLTIFAGNLALRQRHNKIPITFREYSLDDEDEFAINLYNSSYMGHQSLYHLCTQFRYMKLDDPPFERLEYFYVDISSNSQDVVQTDTTRQLESIATFLSGRSLHTHSSKTNIPNPPLPISSNKRPREDGSQLPTSKRYIQHDIQPFQQSYHSGYTT